MIDDASATTHGIRVSVRVVFLDDQSRAAESRFVWAYRVRIENGSDRIVQLLTRSWQVVDAAGRVHHVHGEGVIGEQPVIRPGGQFEYTSGTPLGTASGLMRGSYHMVATETGETFDIAIPAFSLDSPFSSRTVH